MRLILGVVATLCHGRFYRDFMDCFPESLFVEKLTVKYKYRKPILMKLVGKDSGQTGRRLRQVRT